jgi:hypothetical protein
LRRICQFTSIFHAYLIMTIQTLAAFIPIFLAAQPAAHAADLSVETANQVLDQQWQGLRPQGVTQRNVLFQNVRATGSNQFAVTAIVRDYGPGYPANRFYGETCVSHFDEAPFSFRYDGSKWLASGALTASMAKTECKKNPSAGASSVPLQSLNGTPAAAGQIAAGPAPIRSGGLVEGSYECWAYNRARGGLNFTIRGGGKYIDSTGAAGTFSFNPANQRVLFKGGLLSDLGAGFYTMYHEPKGTPTVSMRSNKDGGEVSFCERVSK